MRRILFFSILSFVNIYFFYMPIEALGHLFQSRNYVNMRSMPLYFVTIADTEHYHWLCTLLESIFLCEKSNPITIAVFDLGLTEEEKAHIKSMPNVTIYDSEPINPYLYTKFQVRSDPGCLARGWYSWKPVVLKMALDLYPYVLYLDSGMKLINSTKFIFQHIQEKGYFLVVSHSIDIMTTDYVLRKFNLNAPERSWILKADGISAGLQGVSRKIYNSYVKPMYELAKDIRNFEDDGSCIGGFGFARHDQTLFSIMARLLNFDIMGNENIKLQIHPRRFLEINLRDYILYKTDVHLNK